MIQSKFIKLAIIFALLPIGGNALAMTPGSSKAHWKPESIDQLNPSEVRELNASKCLVTSYRNEEVTSTENATNKPDQYDQLMLVRGEFSEKGQKDLIVFCQSSYDGIEFFKVIWGGPHQCANKLLMDKSSRFMKRYGPGDDYYGSRLKVMPASKTLDFLDMVKNEQTNSDQEAMGITKKWLLEKQKVPKLEHDSMTFFGRGYGFTYYCNGKNWIQLYDYFSDVTD